jgi:hypothetical protein
LLGNEFLFYVVGLYEEKFGGRAVSREGVLRGLRRVMVVFMGTYSIN